MDLRGLAIEIASEVYSAVRPNFGGTASGDVVGEAKSGDFTFAIDAVAEEALVSAVSEAETRSGISLAYYSEDQGLVSPHSAPEYVLVVDPVDGTRPAICALESCCVSVAIARLRGKAASLADVQAACLIELKSGNVISAERGKGVFLRVARSRGDSRIDGTLLAQRADLTRLCWAHEVCARPADATYRVLGDLVNISSFGGGSFVFNSSSFAISRVVLGQIDAYIDPYVALLAGPEREKWLARSRELYGGKVFGLFPYDIAAAAFIAREAGAIVSDVATADKNGSLDSINLLDSSENALLSCIVSSNAALAAKLAEYLAPRIPQPR